MNAIITPEKFKFTKKPGLNLSVSDFKILKVLAESQIGKLYLVQEKFTEKPFAMKELPKDLLPEQELLESSVF